MYVRTIQFHNPEQKLYSELRRSESGAEFVLHPLTEKLLSQQDATAYRSHQNCFLKKEKWERETTACTQMSSFENAHIFRKASEPTIIKYVNAHWKENMWMVGVQQVG